MSTTPIRNLVVMLDTITHRHEALDRAQQRDDLSNAEWAPASRVWCRQQQALSCAIIAEPPQTFDDVLAVLMELAGWHDLIIGQGEDATERELRDLHEMTAVAVANCTVRLAGLFRPGVEPTETQHTEIGRLAKQVEQWLPRPAEAHPRASTEWRAARDRYDAAKQAEDRAIGKAAEAATEARHDAEDVLMAIPSPNAAAFALKYRIAHGDGRETDAWDEMLEAEAKQFSAEAFA